MPSVLAGSAGQVMYVVLTLVPSISSTLLWMSSSVTRLMWPFWTARGCKEGNRAGGAEVGRQVGSEGACALSLHCPCCFSQPRAGG